MSGGEEPYQVEAELWYQPIGYRWAMNLKSYDAEEPRRFVGYYEAMASASAVMLVRATAVTTHRETAAAIGAIPAVHPALYRTAAGR